MAHKVEYKQTGIERIPKDWEVVKVGDIGEVITGTTPSTKVKEYWGKGYPFVTPTDFSDNKYVYKTERSVTQKGTEKARIIPKDSVMVTCIASVGEVSMSPEVCITNQQINTIVCSKKAHPHYVFYIMKFRKNILKRQAGITTSPIIKKSLFEEFPFPLPPLPEQKKIAEILSIVDQAIERVDEAIAKTERLKKGLMQNLLTKGIGHKSFKDTEIGRVPKEWEVVKLDDISLDLIGGGTPSTSNLDYWDGDMAWMTSAHINEREIKTGQRYITKEGLQNSATSVVPKDNLLVATRVSIGKAAINKIDIAISQDLTGIAINKGKSIPDFVYWYLVNNKNRLKALAQGSTIKGILREGLRNLKLPLPLLPEQKKIAEILSTVDKRIQLLREREKRLGRVKKGLMNDLLTGKKRIGLET